VRFRLLLAASLLAAAMPAAAAPLELHRGIGVHDWLNWAPLEADGAYRWPPYRGIEEWLAGARPLTDWPPGDPFAQIRAMGFDFVRLSVDPGPLLASAGAERDEALAVLEVAVRHILDQDLKVVFNLHAVTQKPEYSLDALAERADSAGTTHYRQMVAATAAMLGRFSPAAVALEPYNEPAFYPCEGQGSGEWQTIMAATVADIRAVSADLTIVATGACGGSITGLVDLDPTFDDPNIVYSFHMYEPHAFTHQRLDDPSAFGSGLPWPAAAGTPELVVESLRAQMQAAGLDPAQQDANLHAVAPFIADYFAEGWGPAQLDARFAEALDWASRHGIANERLFMGEFGVIRLSGDGRMGAYDGDRRRYLRAVREAAERHHIPWAIWEYSNPYGMSVILPEGPAVPDNDLLAALGLAPQ